MNLSPGGNSGGGKHSADGAGPSTSHSGNRRKRPNVTPVRNKHPVKRSMKEGGATPLDCILNEIEAFGGSINKKRESAKLKREQRSDDENGPSTSASKPPLPPTPVPSSYKTLTKSELARNEEDSSMLRTFLCKEGLMERILGYKMMRGRVEPYMTVRMIVDLDDCVSPIYEITDDSFECKPSKSAFAQSSLESSPHTKTPSSAQKSKLITKNMSRHVEKLKRSPEWNLQRLSESQLPVERMPERRGPKTPPGSPGAHQERSASFCSSTRSLSTSSPPPPPFMEDASGAPESIEENNCSDNFDRVKRFNERMDKNTVCTPLPPPPAFPNIVTKKSYQSFDKMKERNDKEFAQKLNAEKTIETLPVQELLRHFSSVTNTPVSQLAEYIGEDLQNAMNRLDRKVLLSTLKNALRNVTADTTPPPPVPHGSSQHNQSLASNDNKDYTLESSKTISNNASAKRALLTSSFLMSGCEMEISSEKNNEPLVRQNFGAPPPPFDSSVLPPPPQAPIPSVITPPPPPPFLPTVSHTLPLHSSVTPSDIVKTLPTINLCVPPPAIFTAPPPNTNSTTNMQTGSVGNAPVKLMFSTNVPPPPIAIGTTQAVLAPPPFVGSQPTNLNAPQSAAPTITTSTILPSPHFGFYKSEPPPKIIKVDLTKPQLNLATLGNANKLQLQQQPPPPQQQQQQQPQKPSIVVNLSAMLNNTTNNNRPVTRPRTSTSTSRPPQRPRPMPTVDMEFIKSRPPPPIPDILRKTMAQPQPPVPAHSTVMPTTSSPTALRTITHQSAEKPQLLNRPRWYHE